MVEFLRVWVTNIAAVMIFIIVMDIIMPNGDMKKFTKVIAGLIMILVIIKPFLSLKDIDMNFQLTMLETSSFMEGNVDSKGEELNRYQKAQAMQIFKENIKKQVISGLTSNSSITRDDLTVDVDIVSDPLLPEYGTIKNLHISVKRNAASAVQVSKIEQIKINDDKAVMNGKENEYNLNDSKLCNDIKAAVHNMLGIKEEDVHVEILE